MSNRKYVTVPFFQVGSPAPTMVVASSHAFSKVLVVRIGNLVYSFGGK